jgi:hypothetical protein
MADPALPNGFDRISRSGVDTSKGKGAKNNLPWSMPRNPLISLVSDERIQGNPRESNPHLRGSSLANGEGPRKPKRNPLRITRITVTLY